MSHLSGFTNGASLEDCRTNFYALFDLSGIKWRRLYVDSICIDPLSDPILLTYSECISSGVLAAWRRIVNPKPGNNHVQEESNSLSCLKELWIFWYGDEPDFSKLIKSNLHEAEQGSWECGLSYETRTLFFKALHNAIERGLLSHGYARFGKYFVIPQKLDIHDLNRKQKAIAFNFFIHGESTVCASIDIRVVSAVYILNKLHVTAAQTGHQNVKVILCPYGLTGKLTGNGYKYNDPNMARFLNEWNNFFPHHWKSDQWKIDNEYPHVVEVLVAGARMKYPVSYVFVTEEDHIEAFSHHQLSPGNFPSQSVQPPLKSNSFSADLLTPPMSPHEDPKEKSNRNSLTDPLSTNKPETVQAVNVSSYVTCIKRSVTEECCCSSITSDKTDDNSTLWDFQDPSAIFKCVCSRVSKKLRKKWGPSSTIHNLSHNTNQKSNKTEKSSNYNTGIPFHWRKQIYPPEESFNSSCRLKNNLHTDVSSVKTSNLNSTLPELQTSVCQSQNESLLNASSEAFYTPVASFDPAMPTLSPQPPVPMIKEEPESHFLDSSLNNVSSSCIDSPQGVALKGKISDEILSPFHTSLLNMFENAKNIPKTPPLRGEVDHHEDTNCVSYKNSVVTNTINSIPQVIEKPCLPKRQYEDSDGIQQPMSGMLYDYQYLDSPLWGLSLMKKMTAQRVLCNDESDVDDYAICNSHDVKKPVPCIPKDPYEFTDIDEMTPSERGFRSSAESFKEEEKLMSFSMPSPVDVSPIIPTQEVTSSNPNDTSGKALSPPSTKNFCPKFIREEDLAVSLNDLENIFDTSSSDEENVETTFTPAKLPAYDEFSGKIELSRMYPTPPSLEQNAVPSPYGTINGPDCAVIENDALNEKQESDKNCLFSIEDEEIDVWVPPLIYMFPESPEYSEIELPSLCSSNSDIIYKSSYHPNTRMNYTSSFEDSSYLDKQCTGNLQPALMLNIEQNSSLYNHDNSPDFLINQSTCDSLSSSNMSFANKSITSSNSNMPQSTVEIHPLIVNLLLSDSLLNTFKDINFSSCSICVCNMNIKGSDVGVILPNSLIPSGNNELQYKCTCGFSALVHHQKSYKGGLFYEDEVEMYGTDCDTIEKIFGTTSVEEDHQSKISPFLSTHIPDFILDILRIQCKTINSSFSLFHKSHTFRETIQPSFNSLEFTYGCEICFMALKEGKNAMDNPVPSKLDENFKSSCLHKWPYISSPLPAKSQEVMYVLDSLKSLLQVSIHKKNTQKLWDVTYVVSGPLTWKEFHRLAPRGTEDQCEPQPIPFISTGHGSDCSIIAPFALRHWGKIDLAPYSLQRDIAYIVVAPENDYILQYVKNFFKDLTCCYELNNLGKHKPVTTVLRDGIMRVGKTAASKVAEEPVSEWFNSIGDGPIPNKLRLYARVIKHRLAPHLSTLPLDKTIFKNAMSDQSPESLLFSSSFSPDSNDRPYTPRSTDNDNNTDNHSPILSNLSRVVSEDDEQQPPALMIYIVEPFTFGQSDSSLYRLVTLGLLHSYADMLSSLPEATKNSISLQLISLDSIMHTPVNNELRSNEIKSLAFSIFCQSHSIFSYQSSVKSLTGFGPAAAEDIFLRKNNNKIPNPLKIYNQPYVLASVKDKQTELGEMFGDRRDNSGTLYCCYCLSEDKRFIIASCTNDKGEFTETNVINISVPNRLKRKNKSFQKYGLCKLLEFILEVMSASIQPWRLIIERFGRLGQGELKTWACLLSKKSLHNYSKRLREMCGQCSLASTADIPCILSVCLVSLEPDSTLRLMPDQFKPDDRFSGNRNKSCHLNTPGDASCTHILVFPTSATTQSSQVTFHQEHIDPLSAGLGDDFFEALNDEDINNTDISDLFKMSLGNSPPPESNSQPSSPNAFKHSFSQEGTNQYPSLISDCQDEPSLLLQQPLALGYYVSTANTGTLPKWFWASCPQLENKSPVFLKCALLIHVPYVQKSSEDPLQSNPQQHLTCHPMDSNFTTDVLRYVLEGHNTLSWLALDSEYRDRRSCLPLHIQILIQLYDIVGAIL